MVRAGNVARSHEQLNAMTSGYFLLEEARRERLERLEKVSFASCGLRALL